MRSLNAFFVILFSFCQATQASDEPILGYWAAAGSIIQIKICERFICAEIVHLITEEGVDPLSILDENNSERELQNRTLIGVNLFDGFQQEFLSNEKIQGGRIYDPRRGKFYKSELTLLETGNLLVEGCLLFLCDGEEWLPLEVTLNPDGSRQATLKNSQ